MSEYQINHRRGFTAIEALIAAAILAFLTAAVSGALMAGRQQSKFARDTVYASMLARAARRSDAAAHGGPPGPHDHGA